MELHHTNLFETIRHICAHINFNYFSFCECITVFWRISGYFIPVCSQTHTCAWLVSLYLITNVILCALSVLLYLCVCFRRLRVAILEYLPYIETKILPAEIYLLLWRFGWRKLSMLWTIILTEISLNSIQIEMLSTVLNHLTMESGKKI